MKHIDWLLIIGCFLFSAQAYAAPYAWFRVDQTSGSLNGAAGEIVDHLVNANSAFAIGTGSGVDAQAAQVCNGIIIPSNSTDAEQYGIDSAIDMDADLGVTGTISFWYKADLNWNGGGDRMLVDASTITDNKYFFLVLLNTGELRFRLEDSADADFELNTGVLGKAANTWQHIAFTWDLPNDRMEIFVNGVSEGVNTGNTTGAFGALGSIYFGDNRSTYHPSGTSNSADGVIDEIRIYNSVQTAAEITDDMNATHNCLPERVAHWRFDECSYADLAGEITDALGAYPATPYNGVNITTAGLLGNALDETVNTHQARVVATVPVNSVWTTSVWFKMPFVTTQQYHVLGSVDGGGDLMYMDRNANYRWGVYTPSGGIAGGSFEFGNLSDGWYHMALVGTGAGSNGETELYVDGAFIESVGLQAQGDLKYIGTSYDGAGGSSAQAFGTALDEFIVFGQALSATEVASIYNEQLAGNDYDGTAFIDTTTSCPGALCSALFADEFSTVSFGNNDGDKSFSADWEEYEGSSLTVPESSPDPASGHISISGGVLVMNNYSSESANAPGVERELDLSGYTSATFSFNFVTSGGVDTDDSILIKASSDGGNNWSLLEDITGINDTSGSKSYDITSFISANTKISLRFNTTINDGACCYGGSGETIEIDSINITASKSCATLDHFNINVGAGAASTCTPFAFSITAEDSSNNTVTDYTGSIDITTSTSHGNFAVASATNALSPDPDSDDNGSVSYSFDGADNGQIDLMLDNNHAETLTLTVTDSSASVSTTSSSITFSENAFVIEDNDSQIAGDNVPVAGRDHAYRISMVRQDTTTGVCAVASGYDGAKDLKMWRTQNASDPSASDPALDGDNLPNADPGGNNGTITFTAGVADVLLSSSDIGKFTIELADISNSFSDSTIAGTSAEQIVRPFALAIDFNGQRAADFADNSAVDDSTGSDQSYAADSSGSVLTQAGEGFAITVSGVLWQAADDSDDDGIADSGAFVADNTIAPAFGSEGESVTLSATQFDPASATLGSLSVNGVAGGLFSSFSSGAQSATMTYSNVGIINLGAALTDGDYFGSGVNISGNADKVGRFNPYQYALTSGLVNDACVAGSFTYARQPFSAAATIEAQNKSGARTDGYRDGFATLDIGSELLIENSETGAAFDLQTVSLNEGFSSGTIGSARFDLALRYDMALQAETVTLVEVTGSNDEVTTIAGAPVSLGSTEVRFGRLTLDNAYGSELIDLTMPMQAEYYNGANFIVNGDDTCSTIVDSDLIIVQSLSGGSSTVSIVSTTASSGIFNINLSAPGAGNVGDIDITADLAASGEDWLQFDWDGDGNDDNNPAAKATFGIYSGNSKQIYMRQIFQ